MNFDLRYPIGIMFSLYGLMLVIYGISTSGSEIYQRSLGMNVNLGWGVVLLVFGLAMFALAWNARKRGGK